MEIEQATKKYHRDNSIVYSCQYHVIFCPKYRRKVLTGDIVDRLKALIWEKQAEYGYEVLEIEIMSDHVHLLLDVDPRLGVVNIVGKIKDFTSHSLRKEFPSLKSRLPSLWTRGRFIASAGSVSLEVIKEYLESQKGV